MPLLCRRLPHQKGPASSVPWPVPEVSTTDQGIADPKAGRECQHGSLPTAIPGIAENICSLRALLKLTPSGARTELLSVCLVPCP